MDLHTHESLTDIANFGSHLVDHHSLLAEKAYDMLATKSDALELHAQAHGKPRPLSAQVAVLSRIHRELKTLCAEFKTDKLDEPVKMLTDAMTSIEEVIEHFEIQTITEDVNVPMTFAELSIHLRLQHKEDVNLMAKFDSSHIKILNTYHNELHEEEDASNENHSH